MGTLNCANIITNNMDVNGTLEVDALSGLNQGFQLGSFKIVIDQLVFLQELLFGMMKRVKFKYIMGQNG